MPGKTSSRGAVWITGYRALHLPFAAVGTARRYRVSVESDDVAVVCVGREARFRRLLARVFEGRARLEGVTRGSPLWNQKQRWTREAAVAAIEVHPAFVRRFRAAGWMICPEFVRWRGALDQMPPDPPSRSLRLDLRRVSAMGYTLEQVSGSRLEWDEFTHEMLIPYAERRFKDKAAIPVSALLRKLRSDGTLLFLMQDGCRVAGQAVLRVGDEAWLAGIGVRGGDLALLKDGAVSGLYALTIEWARDNGMRHVDAGRSAAFELDGLAQYKAKWGMAPAREPFSHLIAVRVDPSHAAVRRAMEHEPFWIESDRGELELYPGPGSTP